MLRRGRRKESLYNNVLKIIIVYERSSHLSPWFRSLSSSDSFCLRFTILVLFHEWTVSDFFVLRYLVDSHGARIIPNWRQIALLPRRLGWRGVIRKTAEDEMPMTVARARKRRRNFVSLVLSLKIYISLKYTNSTPKVHAIPVKGGKNLSRSLSTAIENNNNYN